MTLQELGHIDELIAWLDNEQDGAEDAGFVAQSATNGHPALVALRAQLATAEAEIERLRAILPCGHEARYSDDAGQYAECYRCACEALRHRHAIAQNDLATALAESERNKELMIAAETGWDACSVKLKDAVTHYEQLRQRHEEAVEAGRRLLVRLARVKAPRDS